MTIEKKILITMKVGVFMSAIRKDTSNYPKLNSFIATLDKLLA